MFGHLNWKYSLKYPKALVLSLTLLSGLHVLAIVTKTGTTSHDESDCRAVMEICDNLANCCITSPDGQGLDNPGDDRERGQTDVYTTRSVLNSCAQEVTFLLFIS